MQNTGDILQFSGDTSWTQRVYNAERIHGRAMAMPSFLLGVRRADRPTIRCIPGGSSSTAAPYVQDDWKVPAA